MLALSKTNAKRWGDERKRHLFQHGPTERPKEVPTLTEFAPRFVEQHANANRQKTSGIAAKETILEPPSAAGFRRSSARSDHDRTGAEAEVATAHSFGEDRQ